MTEDVSFTSSLEINDRVRFQPMAWQADELGIAQEYGFGTITAVRFTPAKVFYDIIDDYYGILFSDVDSSYVDKANLPDPDTMDLDDLIDLLSDEDVEELLRDLGLGEDATMIDRGDHSRVDPAKSRAAKERYRNNRETYRKAFGDFQRSAKGKSFYKKLARYNQRPSNQESMKNIDNILELIEAGADIDMILNESTGALIPVPDRTAVSVDIQDTNGASTTSPKGSLSMPSDIGTYPISPADAQKILFFKVANEIEPTITSFLAWYPENDAMQYKVTNFLTKIAEKLSSAIQAIGLGENSDYAWIALSYVGENGRMPLLKQVLYGKYVGDYWLDAYGKCIYDDNDGISPARFESDYKVYRSMINDYDLEDLLMFMSAGSTKDTPASEAQLTPQVGISGSDDESTIEEATSFKKGDKVKVNLDLDFGASYGVIDGPGARGLWTVRLFNNHDKYIGTHQLAASDIAMESSGVDDSTMSVAAEIGIPVDQALSLINTASESWQYEHLTTDQIEERLHKMESASIMSAIVNREDIVGLRKELGRRKSESYMPGISFEIDPPASNGVDPDLDRPFKDSGAFTDPTAADRFKPASIGQDIEDSIDQISEEGADPDEVLDSLLFNPGPQEEASMNSLYDMISKLVSQKKSYDDIEKTCGSMGFKADKIRRTYQQVTNKSESMTLDQYLNQKDAQRQAPGSVLLKKGEYVAHPKSNGTTAVEVKMNGKYYYYVTPKGSKTLWVQDQDSGKLTTPSVFRLESLVSEAWLHEDEVLMLYKPKLTDLRIGQDVVIKDKNGQYTIKTKIKAIDQRNQEVIMSDQVGSYTPDEVRILKKDKK